MPMRNSPSQLAGSKAVGGRMARSMPESASSIGGSNGKSARRRLQTAPDAHEQFVVERLAQPPQRSRQAGLAEQQALGSTAHIAFLHQHGKGEQQVEVDLSKRGIIHHRQ